MSLTIGACSVYLELSSKKSTTNHTTFVDYVIVIPLMLVTMLPRIVSSAIFIAYFKWGTIFAVIVMWMLTSLWLRFKIPNWNLGTKKEHFTMGILTNLFVPCVIFDSYSAFMKVSSFFMTFLHTVLMFLVFTCTVFAISLRDLPNNPSMVDCFGFGVERRHNCLEAGFLKRLGHCKHLAMLTPYNMTFEETLVSLLKDSEEYDCAWDNFYLIAPVVIWGFLWLSLIPSHYLCVTYLDPIQRLLTSRKFTSSNSIWNEFYPELEKKLVANEKLTFWEIRPHCKFLLYWALKRNFVQFNETNHELFFVEIVKIGRLQLLQEWVKKTEDKFAAQW